MSLRDDAERAFRDEQSRLSRLSGTAEDAERSQELAEEKRTLAEARQAIRDWGTSIGGAVHSLTVEYFAPRWSLGGPDNELGILAAAQVRAQFVCEEIPFSAVYTAGPTAGLDVRVSGSSAPPVKTLEDLGAALAQIDAQNGLGRTPWRMSADTVLWLRFLALAGFVAICVFALVLTVLGK